MPKSKWGTLRSESKEQREQGAKIGEADIAEVRARMSALSASGETLDKEGKVVRVSAATARALLESTTDEN